MGKLSVGYSTQSSGESSCGTLMKNGRETLTYSTKIRFFMETHKLLNFLPFSSLSYFNTTY